MDEPTNQTGTAGPAAAVAAATPPNEHSNALTAALANRDGLLSSLTYRFLSNSSRARHLFLGEYGATATATATTTGTGTGGGTIPMRLDQAKILTNKIQTKINAEYKQIESNMATATATPASTPSSSSLVGVSAAAASHRTPSSASASPLVEDATGVLRQQKVQPAITNEKPRDTEEIINRMQTTPATAPSPSAASSALAVIGSAGSQSLVASGNLSARQMLIASKREIDDVRPEWHAPWKLMRVISAHSGWVRAIAVDHSNEWFATGSVDRTIKIFDLASGNLKLTLTGHISGIRGLAISKLTPYMFSIGEDKQVKCWDMHQNKVIRDYHAHLSGGYCCSLLENESGPNILVTGGRDSVGRVWDIRTAAEVAVLCGHTQTVASIQCQMGLPQVITGSHDTTIKLWDLRKTAAPISTLTHHKKSVRALQIHPTEYTFTSGAGDNLKVWKCPDGAFLRNLSGHNATINALALNRDNVLVSGGDNGSLHFWDYKSGYSFQQHQTQPQPGSLDAESGIFAMTFDQTGSRLLTAETDKSIKVYREDENAVRTRHKATCAGTGTGTGMIQAADAAR